MAVPFVEVDHVSLKAGKHEVLKNLSFTINRGESWAIVGPSGSGKTTLGRLLVSRRYLPQGTIRLHAPAHTPVLMVEQQHQFSHYEQFYQEARFHSSEAEHSPLVEEVLEGVTKKQDVAERKADIEHITQLLNIAHLRASRLISLSNGEQKRLQLAMALLQKPQLLILDNPFIGLDIDSRKVLHGVISHLMDTGITLVLITAPSEIPQPFTYIMELEKGAIKRIVSRKEYQPEPYKVQLPADWLTQLEALERTDEEDFHTAVHLRKVTVRYGNKTILDQVDWQILKGEHWALTGHNGAGKSTLLSLISGSNPQAYANDIVLFDRKRGSGESIWDIKKKIGFVSPEQHLFFNRNMSCADVVASGLFDKMVLREQLTEAQTHKVQQWMKLLQVEKLRTESLGNISLGEQRLVLLARALVKNPPMLLLDEPCQGLDTIQKAKFVYLVDAICRHFQKTLIYVSHYAEEMPACIDQVLSLTAGKARLVKPVSALLDSNGL